MTIRKIPLKKRCFRRTGGGVCRRTGAGGDPVGVPTGGIVELRVVGKGNGEERLKGEN